MESFFFSLTQQLAKALLGTEQFFCWFSGENSDFARFNHGKIRQAGHVEQVWVKLQLVDRRRQASAELLLTFDLTADLTTLTTALSDLRDTLQNIPEDPYILFNETPTISRFVRSGELPSGPEMASDVVRSAHGKDLVGLLSAGSLIRGFASSIGHQSWHETPSVLLDTSLYFKGDQAIKASYAGFSWELAQIQQQLSYATHRMEFLAKPIQHLRPGAYRAYLAPAALAEILGILGWGGFSTKAIRTRQSALVHLSAGEWALSPKVTISEKTREGLAPAFQAEGFLKPTSTPLIQEGRLVGTLISPRSAQEYGISTNGANSTESPESLDMAPGSLATSDILSALGTGLWISNLWYLNYSDRGTGRITGMTRFATFWVENGQIIGPTPVMRFDDSIYKILGDRLESLTTAREFFPEPTTYGERQTNSIRLPGALIENLTLTL